MHGSNGWDVTAAVVALAQLMLDPYFRSVQGYDYTDIASFLCPALSFLTLMRSLSRFLKLVEKEWIRMGHPFTSRMGHFGKTSKHERAPTFLIFLDCVYQVGEIKHVPSACSPLVRRF